MTDVHRAAIADAIQNLMAARLGRSFRPLALLIVIGAVGMLGGPGPGLPLALGAILASAEMLGYGLCIVQRALDRPARLWTHLASWASLYPPLFGGYVCTWLGLRGLTVAPFGIGWLGAILFVVSGVWVVRSWMQVAEIERLAKVMMLNLEGGQL